MSKVIMMATFSCKEGMNDQMDAALKTQVAAVAELEGAEVYCYHRGEGESYGFFAVFSSMEAMQAQGQSEALQKALSEFQQLLTEPPNMTMWSPVAGFGLDL